MLHGFRPLLLLCFFSLALFDAAIAQENRWVQTNGPHGGPIHSIVRTPAGNIVVATGDASYYGPGESFRSTNGGLEWDVLRRFPRTAYGPIYEQSTTGLTVIALEASGNLLGIRHSRLMRSTNDGLDWVLIDSMEHWGTAIALGDDRAIYVVGNGVLTRLRPGRPNSVMIGEASLGRKAEAMTIAPDGGLYVGVAGGRIYHSSDRGDSWTSRGIGAGDSASTIRAMHMGSDGRLLAGTSSGLYHSLDGGRSWNRSRGVAGSYPINCILSWNGRIYLGTTGSGLLASFDAGESWMEIGAGLASLEISSLAPGEGSDLYAGTPRGFNISNDAGATWRESSSGIIATRVGDILVDRDESVYATTPTGLFRTTDQGDSWRRLDDPPGGGTFGNLVLDSAGAVIAWMADASLLRSTDRGESWRTINHPRSTSRFYSLMVGPRGDLFIGAGRDTGDFVGGVLRSVDGGATWDLVLDGIEAIGLAVSSSGAIFVAGGVDGVWRSTDNGDTWSRVTVGPDGMGRRAQIILADRNRGIYMLDAFWIWRSFDDGETWEFLWTGLQGYDNIGSIAISSRGDLVATLHDYYARPKVILSTDKGSTWRDASDSTEGAIWNLTPAANGSFYAASARGVYRSGDLRARTPDAPPRHVGLALDQNQPNPFSTTSTIRFELASAADVRLALFDMLGNEVALLYRGHAERGEHRVEIDRGELPSGVYGCRLQSGSMVVVRQVVVE